MRWLVCPAALIRRPFPARKALMMHWPDALARCVTHNVPRQHWAIFVAHVAVYGCYVLAWNRCCAAAAARLPLELYRHRRCRPRRPRGRLQRFLAPPPTAVTVQNKYVPTRLDLLPAFNLDSAVEPLVEMSLLVPPVVLPGCDPWWRCSARVTRAAFACPVNAGA